MKKQGNHVSGSATQETAILGGALVDASEVRADIATHKSPLKSSIRAVGVEEVKYNYAPSSFEASSYKHKGLTEEAMFAISSIATIATGGVMASSMSGVTLASNAVANAAMHGGIIAGASALASSAAVNLANNQGHLGRTIKATTSRKNLESIGKSALIGGITGGALEYTGLNGDLSKLSGRDLYGTIAKKVLVEELVSTGISGSDPSKIAERVGQRTILATAHHKVGDIGVAAKLPDGGIAKMVLHGTVAGSFAQATGDKFGRGFAGGALGEFVGSKLYKGKGYKGYDPSRDIAGLSAGVTSMALGGSAKSMGRASQVSMSGHEYNTVAHAVRYGVPIAFDAALTTEAVATTAMGASIIEARDTLSDTKAKLETAALQKVLDIGLGLIIPDSSSGPTVISTPIHEQKPQIFVTPPYQGPKVQLETYPESDSRFTSPVLPGFTAPAKEFKLPGYEAPTLPDMRIMYNENVDGGGEKLKLDPKHQPWNVRTGQEWKGKVMGKGQKSTPGHEVRSYRIAIKEAKKDSVEKVHLNQGMNKVTGSKPGTHKPNYRHDVTVTRKDGRIDVYEVRSKTDNPDDLLHRMADSQSKLPEKEQGTAKLVEITRSKK